MVQESCAEPAPKSPPIAGSATVTTDPWMNAGRDPRMVAASAARGCGVGHGRAAAANSRSQGPGTALDMVLVAPQGLLPLTCSQILAITTEPSPTAEATRFTEPARTSPTA